MGREGFRNSPIIFFPGVTSTPLRYGFMLRVNFTFKPALAFISCSVNFRLASSRFGVRSAPFRGRVFQTHTLKRNKNTPTIVGVFLFGSPGRV